jgi:uncharacterized integral membrane protein (TIGR00698 family)
MEPETKRRRIAEIWRQEDWLVVWIGLLALLLLVAGLRPALPGWKWTGSRAFAQKVVAWQPRLQDLVQKELGSAPETLRAKTRELVSALAQGERAAVAAASAALSKDLIGDAASSAPELTALVKEISSTAGQGAGQVFSATNMPRLLFLFLGFAVVSGAGVAVLRGRTARFLLGFPVVFALASLAMFIGGNSTISYYGLETVFWALLLGLLVGNTVGVPEWLKPAVRTEFYIKIGLVLLGAEVLFSTLVTTGAVGILQAVVVISAVFYFCYWVARRLGLDDEFAAILGTGVSVCGVSAAIAAGGAIKGDPKKVSHTISLVLLCAVPMLIVEPLLARLLGLSAAVTGAWIGGTIDTTGAVVAAGSIAGSSALSVAVVVKMAQNVLIGVVALLLAIWFSFKRGSTGENTERPRASEIWARFPKFVLGFLAASLLFSFLLSQATAKAVTAFSSPLRGWLFTLAFVSIGLETRFRELVSLGRGRPAAAFLIAQAFNILVTLGVAYLLFGGVLFGKVAP